MSDIWNEFPMEAAEPPLQYESPPLNEEERKCVEYLVKRGGNCFGEGFSCGPCRELAEKIFGKRQCICRDGEGVMTGEDSPQRRRIIAILQSVLDQQDPLPLPEVVEPAKDFLFVAMAKISAASLEDAEDHLYATLCIPGDIGFSINSYAITAENGDQLRFKEVGRTGDADTPVEIARLFDVPEEALKRGREHDKFASEALARWFEQIEAKLKDMDYPNYQPTEAEIADIFKLKTTHEPRPEAAND